jgi:orotate phosphoribosyltransferase
MDTNDVLRIFKETHGLLEGHFQLTSGLHSPQYFQCAKVLQYPAHATVLCSDIADHFRGQNIESVIAPAIGGIVVAQEVGRLLGLKTMFAERKEQVMQLRRGFEIHHGERVLVCEDVVTTGGSVREVIEIVRELGGIVAGVASIVDRSNGATIYENFHPVMTMHAVTYKPDACPLCKEGIPVEKPGSRPGHRR